MPRPFYGTGNIHIPTQTSINTYKYRIRAEMEACLMPSQTLHNCKYAPIHTYIHIYMLSQDKGDGCLCDVLTDLAQLQTYTHTHTYIHNTHTQDKGDGCMSDALTNLNIHVNIHTCIYTYIHRIREMDACLMSSRTLTCTHTHAHTHTYTCTGQGRWRHV
jgi:hypothetical protein